MQRWKSFIIFFGWVRIEFFNSGLVYSFRIRGFYEGFTPAISDGVGKIDTIFLFFRFVYSYYLEMEWRSIVMFKDYWFIELC